MWRNNLAILIDGKLSQESRALAAASQVGSFTHRNRVGKRTLIKGEIDINKEPAGMHCANKIWTGPPNIPHECVDRVRLEIRGQERGELTEEGGVKEKPIFYPLIFFFSILSVLFCSGGHSYLTEMERWREKSPCFRPWMTSALWSEPISVHQGMAY